MRLLACFAAAGIAVAAFPAKAANIAYGEAFDTLYRIDLESREATPVGGPTFYQGQRIGNISGLTASPDGAWYAVGGGRKLLLKVDTTTGANAVVGQLSLAGQGSGQYDALDLGMAADCDGTVWLASGVLQQVWKVDAASGATTLVGATGHPISGLVARGSELYGAGYLSDHGFYRIDKATGAATRIGDFGSAASTVLNTVSMSFDAGGTLWAVLNYVPPTTGNTTPDWSDLARIDPATGKMTLVGAITGPGDLRGVGMKGFSLGPPSCRPQGSVAVSAPVGSPPTLAVLALLLMLAGVWAARRAAA